MGEDGRIVYKIVVDGKSAVVEAGKFGEEVGEKFGKKSEGGAGFFKEVMIGAARAVGEAFVQMAQKGVQGVEQIAQAGIEFNAKMEKYQTAFTTLIGDADAAAAAMEQIRKDAASTPFDVDSLTAANQALLATGMDAGKARDDVLNLANAIAATGGGSAELSRMAANMQQIRNTGKATAMDIRQFANAGINIYGLLADSMDVTVEEAAEMDVTYDQLTETFAKAAEAGGAYAGAMEAQSQTFNGRMSTLKDNATQLAGALTEDLFSTLSGEGLPMVMDWVATLLEAAQTGGIEGALTAAKDILKTLIDGFVEGLPDMIDTGMELLDGLLMGIADATPFIIETAFALILALVEGLISNVDGLVDSAIAIIFALADGLIGALPILLEKAPVIIQKYIDSLVNNAPKLLVAAVELLLKLAQGIISNLPLLLSSAVQIIGSIVSGILNGLSQILDAGKQIINKVWDGVKSLNPAEWGRDLVAKLASGITGAIGKVADAAKGIANKVKSFLHFSLPDEGPLRELPQWPADMIDMYTSGIEDGEEDIHKTFHRTFDVKGDVMSGFDDIDIPAAMDSIVSDLYMSAGQGMYYLPDVSYTGMNTEQIEREMSVKLTATGKAGDMLITVPVNIDGREVARASAWAMGEQLAWEEL